MSTITVQSVDDAFEPLRRDADQTVPREFVSACMRSGDVEVLGALYGFMRDARYAERVAPPLPSSELFAFFTHYLGRCLREDPAAYDFIAQRALTRYGAAWDVVRWYVRLWKVESAGPDALAAIREWLAELYLRGNLELRTCLIGATLEPLFGSAQVRRSFGSWQARPVLHHAYERAAFAAAERCGSRGRTQDSAVDQEVQDGHAYEDAV